MKVAPGDLLVFALSAGLLLGTTLLVARRLARNLPELFWLLPACVSLQLGVLACGLSFGGWMTPRWWLAGQGVLLAGVLLWARRRPHPGPLHIWEPLRSWWTSAPAFARAAAATALLLIVLSGLRQAVEPLSGFDDRMYHASRVAYWMQNASILPYPTHNERQVAFPFGSELCFFWPVLFTKWEAAGRLVFWLGYPMAAIGIHLLAGRAGAREPFRSFAVLLFVSTPVVSSLSIGLAPEFWLAVFELGMAFWILQAAGAEDIGKAARAGGWAGLFLLLALNVKTTAVGLMLPAALLPLVIVSRSARWPTFRTLVAGAFAGFFLSGLVLNSVGNVLRCGNPFASAGLRRVVRGDLNPRQLYIHAVRLPFLLFEIPWIPDPLRGRLEASGEALAEKFGATQTISFEDSKWPWPGRFHFNLPGTAQSYSLGGLLWLPGLACALFVVVWGIWQRRRLGWSSPILLCTLLALLSFLPVVFGLRWMVGSGVPVRFLIAPWTLGAVLLALLTSPRSTESPGRALFAALLVVFQAVPSLLSNWKATRAALQTPLSEAALDEPFADVLPNLPSGSHVLLFANQDTRDYPLFRPREGFPNRVVAWGEEPLTAELVARRTLATGTTHVLFLGNEWLMHGGRLPRPWIPTPMRVADVINGLAADPRLHEIPLKASGMKLFEVVRSR